MWLDELPQLQSSSEVEFSNSLLDRFRWQQAAYDHNLESCTVAPDILFKMGIEDAVAAIVHLLETTNERIRYLAYEHARVAIDLLGIRYGPAPIWEECNYVQLLQFIEVRRFSAFLTEKEKLSLHRIELTLSSWKPK